MKSPVDRQLANRPRGWRQLARFVVVGGANTALTYVIYAALVCLGVHYNLALVLDYAAGMAIGYAMHRRWTFAHQGRAADSFGKFVASYVVVFLVNLALLNALAGSEAVLSINVGPLVGQAIALVLSSIAGFVIQKLWVFKHPTATPLAAPHFSRHHAAQAAKRPKTAKNSRE